ncbi:FAD-dependent oxidoreductase [Parapedobacter sp. 10938]|uniref:FAD-dependent oxidoreductase n=1 Tax=Parapedobacter flavus TaxID=3110225 RepID=UPI002DBD8E32|nr:FAD-dependent oxidoreductase [Parapedobacter sp. 10938]MEC3879936.1 FAD-dependent oxidoreductase [Parapedobacter sp. 10938]
METKKSVKNLIIGFGKGGKTLAAFLAKRGESVALVEQSADMYGGACINIACVPTKSLIVEAEKGTNYPHAHEVKDLLTATLRQTNFEKLAKLENVEIITGKAAFRSPTEVAIQLAAGGETQIEAERIFINTGSQPAIPPIEGMDSEKVFTSAELIAQAGRPEKLVIVGGGFIGLEFADMFAKFGTEVTVLDRRTRFLPDEDEDVAGELFKILTDKTIRILNGVNVEKLEEGSADSVTVHFTHAGQRKSVEANAVLLATGRKPNTDGLNLAAAGIQTDERGYIQVNDQLKTSVPHIWAIGDCNGGPQFTYISLDDFHIIRNQLAGNDQYNSLNDRKPYPTCVFVSPPLAQAGLREKEARERGYDVKVLKIPASAIPKAAILNEKRGLLKAVIDAKTDRILGCTLCCAEAHEMINTVQLAIHTGVTYDTLANMIFTHPSMTEALNDLFAAE